MIQQLALDSATALQQLRFSNCASETMPASVTALQQLRDSAAALQQPPRFNNCASATAAAVQQLHLSNCRGSATAAIQQLRFSNCRDSETGPAVQRLCVSKYLMTLKVQCDLGPEHPCPKPNVAHGLLRFVNRASMSNT